MWRRGPAAVPGLRAVPSAFTLVLQGVQAPNDRSYCRHSLTPRGRGYFSSKATVTFCGRHLRRRAVSDSTLVCDLVQVVGGLGVSSSSLRCRGEKIICVNCFL